MKRRLGISERAVITFDDFLLSRYHMFVMVYFHYRAVCLEQLLLKYFRSESEEYSIPADIEKYIEHDDHLLMKVLRNSKNRYAQDVVNNVIPKKIYESFNSDQLINLERIQQFLQSEDLDYIRCSSSGRLSKYYSAQETLTAHKLYVVRSLFPDKQKLYFPIDKATDLFKNLVNLMRLIVFIVISTILTPSNRKKSLKLLNLIEIFVEDLLALRDNI